MFDEVNGLMRLRALVDESTLEHPIKEELLLCFLRARKYNVDRAFKSLKNYLKMVKNYPELFTNLSAFKLRFQLKEQLQLVYKSRDKQGRRIFIFRAGRWNPKECSLDDIFRCNLFCLQQLASNLDSQINGIVAIVDLENLGLHQARHFTPSYAKKIADLLIETFPISFQIIHIVNQNWIVHTLMSIIWPFLSAKIQKRMLYHGSCWASLHEYVDVADLPEDYGGFRERLDCSKLPDTKVSIEETCNLFNLN
ncbi:alpha-tocopherol transfer protein-like [Daphnia pulex]|uniref:alpha-tocopherol transfer protein-like n=1 Tax=Daphnia pulex TaxID=6669 RepID=UPI001EE1452A|nr:alpha-tocopherol transfer protein-like [Daphnia pulex]XP_046438206.1 alpha-tocopherol transfer protein-like [Daphnia pulex]XP_046438273.1 alpha-tocopherol transfer protein-like [Daphnia pulex]XP_046438345.1 alpha-tocopherol transfer protein-like [Daphnia pulex]XP_046438413.1 alpha-tocopherol transfer protein-like [Daphnia pulex]XP_046438472.1 alpha-tocopherol transfer protein-like [Daphnia pulex]